MDVVIVSLYNIHFVNQYFLICQSIGVLLIDFRNSFVLENGLLPKKPLKAASGLGCGDVIIK